MPMLTITCPECMVHERPCVCGDGRSRQWSPVYVVLGGLSPSTQRGVAGVKVTVVQVIGRVASCYVIGGMSL